MLDSFLLFSFPFITHKISPGCLNQITARIDFVTKKSQTAESLLENDERLEDAIEFFVHNLEGSLHLVKSKGMGRHERCINALHLQHAHASLQSQTPTRTH